MNNNFLKISYEFEPEAFEKGKEYMVWFKGERFIGKFDNVTADKKEIGFWTYGGGRVIHDITSKSDFFVIPLDEIIPEEYLKDTPPIR